MTSRPYPKIAKTMDEVESFVGTIIGGCSTADRSTGKQRNGTRRWIYGATGITRIPRIPHLTYIGNGDDETLAKKMVGIK